MPAWLPTCLCYAWGRSSSVLFLRFVYICCSHSALFFINQIQSKISQSSRSQSQPLLYFFTNFINNSISKNRGAYHATSVGGKEKQRQSYFLWLFYFTLNFLRRMQSLLLLLLPGCLSFDFVWVLFSFFSVFFLFPSMPPRAYLLKGKNYIIPLVRFLFHRQRVNIKYAAPRK